METDLRRILLIINPISGTLPKEGLKERAEKKLLPAGFSLETAVTERAGHAFELARRAMSDGYYAVIAAGGDGTVNEIASAVRDSNTAMGILPYGSGNGLARHLLKSIDVDHALDVIAKNKILKSDYGTVNGIPFFCTFGMGFDADVSREFSTMSRRGLMSYIRSAVSQWFKFKPIKYEITAFDGTEEHHVELKAFIVAVCNASQYGNNAFIAPQASVHDGFLDIVIVHDGNPLARAMAGAELFTGRINRNLLIETIKAKKATIRRFPGATHVDGEPRIMPETLDIECHTGKLLLFSDPDKQPFKPFITPFESIREDSTYLVRENARIALRNLKALFKK